MGTNEALAPLARAIGTWAVTGSHPYLLGRELRGRVAFEWIEGGAFVRMRTTMDDGEIPDGVAIFGTDGAREDPRREIGPERIPAPREGRPRRGRTRCVRERIPTSRRRRCLLCVAAGWPWFV